MNDMQTILEKEQREVGQVLCNEKWLLVELIFGYCWLKKGILLSKSELAAYSLDQLEFIEQAIENRELEPIERGVSV